MKISAVNNQIKTPNFRGLWGKTSMHSDIDPVMNILKVENTYYYYPFLDETPSQIKETVDKNSEAYIDESSPQRYIVKQCKVCYPLPFSEAEYNKYKYGDKSTRLTSKIKKIHVYVKSKYFNNELGQQISCENTNITQRLNKKA